MFEPDGFGCGLSFDKIYIIKQGLHPDAEGLHPNSEGLHPGAQRKMPAASNIDR